MKLKTLVLLTVVWVAAAGLAHADLGGYIDDLNVFARGNAGDFKVRLGARFGTPQAQVEVVLSNTDSPADAALVFWLGERSRQPLERVLRVYRGEKSKGWGQVAKSLGIKPGSAEFHALKAGNLDFFPSAHADAGKSNGKGNGKQKSKKN